MKSFQARVYVTLKKSVLDPQGSALKHALSTMGYESVDDVRVGKFLEVNLKEKSQKEAQAKLEEICDKLLANPVIEEYRLELSENEGKARVK